MSILVYVLIICQIIDGSKIPVSIVSFKKMPIIIPNYCQNPCDLQVIIRAVKIALALGKTEAFKKLGTKFYDKKCPGCDRNRRLLGLLDQKL